MSAAITNGEFLEAMFADLPDGAAAMVCGFAGDPKPAEPTEDDRKRWFALPWMFGQPVPWRCKSGSNNYCAVSSFHPLRDGEHAGEYRRRKEAFARLHAVMLDDLGDGPGAKVSMRHADKLPVSALVETSPRNYQAWLFLEADADTDDRDLAERLIDRMIADGLAANTDPGMSGVTRYGRLPVGVNGKAKYLQDGKPFPVRLARWNPEFRYTVREVAQAFGLNLTATRNTPAAVPRPDDAELARRCDGFAALLELVAHAGLYQAALGEGRHAITCPWFQEHTGQDKSGTALIEPSAANKWRGVFRCHHGHGEKLYIGDVLEYLRDHVRRTAA